MKKISVIILIGLFAFFFIYKLFFLTAISKKTINYRLNNKNYRLIKAETKEQWEKGLMNYRKLDQADGMIFIFPDKRIRSFWNKNTFMDLKLYWLNDEQIVGESDLPSIEKSKNIVEVTSQDKVNKVIELVK